MKDVVDRLEQLMYGHNYEVAFGMDVFENCKTVNDLYSQLKLKYQNTNPQFVQLVLFDRLDFWNEIEYGFAFRGDNSAGLKLSSKKDQELTQEVEKYKSLIKQFLSDETMIYSYPDETGIPFYVVYWGYAFILFNKNKPSLFIFGGASD